VVLELTFVSATAANTDTNVDSTTLVKLLNLTFECERSRKWGSNVKFASLGFRFLVRLYLSLEIALDLGERLSAWRL
jgi:hypothetical protein